MKTEEGVGEGAASASVPTIGLLVEGVPWYWRLMTAEGEKVVVVVVWRDYGIHTYSSGK